MLYLKMSPGGLTITHLFQVDMDNLIDTQRETSSYRMVGRLFTTTLHRCTWDRLMARGEECSITCTHTTNNYELGVAPAVLHLTTRGILGDINQYQYYS